MNRKRWMSLLIVFLMAVSCSGGIQQNTGTQEETAAEGQKQYVIGVSIPTTDLFFRNAMYELVQEVYPDGNTDQRAQVIVYDGKNSQRQQNQDIKDMVELGVDGLWWIPIPPKGRCPLSNTPMSMASPF